MICKISVEVCTVQLTVQWPAKHVLNVRVTVSECLVFEVYFMGYRQALQRHFFAIPALDVYLSPLE